MARFIAKPCQQSCLAACFGAAALLPAPAVAQSARASTLRFVPSSDLVILDPVWTTAGVTMEHAYYVFDMLYAVDSNLRPHPQMAEGHTVSDDGRTWRIRLRDGLKFHDGEPVRAIVSAKFCSPPATPLRPPTIVPSASASSIRSRTC
jgi:ABC-type transport system substrate-binding protein